MNRNKLRGPVGRSGSWARFEILALMVVAALVLGVASAAGRTQATTRVVVEVLGSGDVESSPGGIDCDANHRLCYAAFSGSGSVKLTATHPGGWDSGTWSGGGCGGSNLTPCTIPLDGADHAVTANFVTSSGIPLETLTVGFSKTNGGNGNVTGPQLTPPGSQVNCDSAIALPDCSWTVLQGSILTVFQTAAAGNLFEGWGGDCRGFGESCTVLMDQDRSVGATWGTAGSTAQLAVSITGQGQVRGNGINCPGVCVASQPLNTSATLTADPSNGYIFSGWSGGCTGTSPTCTVTMNGDAAVTATFAIASTLTVTVNGSGTVSGGSGAINCGSGANVCSAAFAQNAVVSVVATAATGAVFTGWTGACGGSTTTCTVAMNQSKDVTATFTSTAGFTLSVAVSGSGIVTGGGINCGAGAVTCSSGNHTQGSTSTLVASPGPGATFAGWGGSCSGTVTTCTVTFTSSLSVSATFTGGPATPTTAELGVSVTGPGRVTGGGIACGNGAAACSTSVPVGSSVVLAESPASGAKFAGWGGACTGTATTCTVVLSAAKAVSATFTGGAAPGTLTLGVSGRGVVSTSAGTCASTGPAKTCVQHFKAGATPTLTATPAPGQSFLGWSGACSGKKPTCKVDLRTAQSATARFTQRSASSATLTAVGAPIVLQTSTGYSVTLRFLTTVGGTARVRAVRAGRKVTSVAAKVGAGRVRVGPFPVPLPGLYTFEIRLAGSLLKMRACLGTCGAAAPPPPFLLFREPPIVTRTGDAWSVTLHTRANQIYDGRLRATRPGRVLVNQHFLGQAGRTAFGPFLLGPGNYTLTLTGVDAYGRTRTIVWVVSLA